MAETYTRTEHKEYASRITHSSVVYTDPPGSTVPDLHVNAPRYYVSTYGLTGEKNPRWRSQVATGHNATTPLTGTELKIDSAWVSAGVEYSYQRGIPPFTYQYVKGDSWGYPHLALSPTSAADASTVSKATNRCIAKFFDDYKSKTSAFESGQDLGEIKETLHAMINPLSSLRSHVLSYFSELKKIRRGLKHAPSLRKALGDTYLEFTFGWKPLASDIADAYAKMGQSHYALAPFSVGATEYYGGTFAPASLVNTGYTINGSCQSRGKYQVRYRGAFRVRPDASGRLGKSQELQLTLEDFLPTAWDLLPYSFIVDYFTNVGDIIRAYAYSAVDMAWGCKTTRDYQIVTQRYKEIIPNSIPSDAHYILNRKYLYGGNLNVEYRRFTRSILTSGNLIPVFQFEIPHAKPWENIGAIISSNVRSLTPFYQNLKNPFSKIKHLELGRPR